MRVNNKIVRQARIIITKQARCLNLTVHVFYLYCNRLYCFQLQAAAIVPPFSVYKGIVSSLEKWTENPTASYEPYVTMRRTYPGGEQSDTGNKKEVVNER